MKNSPNKPDDARGCPICGASASYVFTSKHNREILGCQGQACGHFFTPPTVESQGVCLRYDDLETESDQALKEFDARNRELLGLFLKQLGEARPAPLTFLDFGSGNAHVSRSIKSVLKEKVNIFCLEANPKCENFYPKYGLVQVKSIPDVPPSLDLIYLIEVIEHLDDPIATLKSLRERLKSNGVLFLSTPIGRIDEKLTNAYDTPSHLHFFTMQSLNIALRAAGFSPIEYRYYPQMYPRHWKRDLKGAFFNGFSRVRETIRRGPSSRDYINHLVGFTRPVNSR